MLKAFKEFMKEFLHPFKTRRKHLEKHEQLNEKLRDIESIVTKAGYMDNIIPPSSFDLEIYRQQVKMYADKARDDANRCITEGEVWAEVMREQVRQMSEQSKIDLPEIETLFK